MKSTILRIMKQNPEANSSELYQFLSGNCRSIILSVEDLVKFLRNFSKQELRIDQYDVKNKILKIMEQSPEADCGEIFQNLPAKYLCVIGTVDVLVQFLRKRNLLVRYVQSNPGEEHENQLSDLIDDLENFRITTPIDTIGDNESILEI